MQGKKIKLNVVKWPFMPILSLLLRDDTAENPHFQPLCSYFTLTFLSTEFISFAEHNELADSGWLCS